MQIHNKLQDIGNYLFTNDLNDSLNNSSTTMTEKNNVMNIDDLYEQTFDENLNIIHNNLANSNFINDDNDLYIIENSLNKKKLGQIERLQTFSPGDQRHKHYF